MVAVCLLLLAALCLASSTLLNRRLAAVLQQEWRLMAAQAARTWQATTAPAPAAGKAPQTGLEAATAAASVAPQELPETEQNQSPARPLHARAEGRNEQMCMAASSSTDLQIAFPIEPPRARRRAKQAPSAALLAAGATQIATQHGAAPQASTQPAAACRGGEKAQRLDKACSLQPARKEGNDGTSCCLHDGLQCGICRPHELDPGLQATMSAFQLRHLPLSTFSRPSQLA